MFLYPPRPTKAIPPDVIKTYEKKGWIAQLKKNGTGSSVTTNANGDATFWTRHGEPHKAWVPTDEARKFFKGFPDSSFAFELLHSKGPEVKDTVYIYDVMRWLGKDLIGKPFYERLELLDRIQPFSSKIIIAKTYERDLYGLFMSLKDGLDEGIVLKDPNSVLRSCMKEGLNDNWQVKCRKATKNYGW